MGTYFTLLNALAEDGRLDEAEELWTKLFSQYLESMPRIFFNKMVAIYYQREMHDKMFEVISKSVTFLELNFLWHGIHLIVLSSLWVF